LSSTADQASPASDFILRGGRRSIVTPHRFGAWLQRVLNHSRDVIQPLGSHPSIELPSFRWALRARR
jgi:hypothetical protein